MPEYITSQGDAWDSICYKLFNDENYMSRLLELNPQYNEIVIFPANITLETPEVEKTSAVDFPAWRKRVDD